MSPGIWIAVALGVLAIALALLVALRTELTRARGGKVLAFLAIFLLPLAAAYSGFQQQMESSESTQFCLSCHVMTDFGRSLYVDDPSYIPAVHFQNRLVPRDAACYTCHTDYTLFGTVHSKFRGLRHLYVEYLGTIPKPEQIRLYTPYNNRECLHCHADARPFLEAKAHHRQPGLMDKLTSNRVSCLSSGCHDIVHDVGDLPHATFWKGH